MHSSFWVAFAVGEREREGERRRREGEMGGEMEACWPDKKKQLCLPKCAFIPSIRSCIQQLSSSLHSSHSWLPVNCLFLVLSSFFKKLSFFLIVCWINSLFLFSYFHFPTYTAQAFVCPPKNGQYPDPIQCDKYYICQVRDSTLQLNKMFILSWNLLIICINFVGWSSQRPFVRRWFGFRFIQALKPQMRSHAQRRLRGPHWAP